MAVAEPGSAEALDMAVAEPGSAEALDVAVAEPGSAEALDVAAAEPGSAEALDMAAAAVVFDLGGVLIDWDPRYVLDDAAVAALDIDGAQRELDRGTPVAEVHARWRARFPARVALVDRYFGDWHRTIAGPIDATVAVLAELRDTSVRLYALSNFSGELFRQIRPRFAFLDWFDGLLISGDEGVIKPDARIYRLLVERFALTPPDTVFVDDRQDNVAGGRAAGLVAIHYRSAPQLRRDLSGLGLL